MGRSSVPSGAKRKLLVGDLGNKIDRTLNTCGERFAAPSCTGFSLFFFLPKDWETGSDQERCERELVVPGRSERRERWEEFSGPQAPRPRLFVL